MAEELDRIVQNNRKKWGVRTEKRGDGWVWTLEKQHPEAMSRARESRDVGCSQVSAQKQHPNQANIPHPTHEGTNRDVPENQPSLPMKSA